MFISYLGTYAKNKFKYGTRDWNIMLSYEIKRIEGS